MELTQQRAAIAIDLDRPRFVFFDMRATGLLIVKYGNNFLSAFYDQDGDTGVRLKSIDALAFFLWAGLQADARQRGETLTEAEVETFIVPLTFAKVFAAVLSALTGATFTPVPKAPAPGAAAAPSAAVAAAGPGPTKASTSLRRSVSRTASSAGRRTASGRRP